MSIDSITEALSSVTINSVEPVRRESFARAILGNGRMQEKVNGAQCQKYISLISAVAEMAVKAFTAMEEGEYERFDALVSECACQLRAIRIAELATKKLSLDEVKEIFIKIRDTANAYKVGNSFSKKLFKEVIEQNKLDCQVSDDELYIVDTYILTLTKKVIATTTPCFSCREKVDTTCEVTDASLVAKEKNLMEAVIKVMKTRVAKTSVAFIREKSQDNPIMLRLLGVENERTIQGRVEIPCFYSLTQFLSVAARGQVPVLLKVQYCNHFVEDITAPFDVKRLYLPQDGAYKSALLDAISVDSPMIVIEGRRSGVKESIESYNQRLSQYSLEVLASMNAAQHSQYTDKILGIPLIEEGQFPEEATKIEKYSAMAKERGCSFDNQTLLLMSHIFVSCMKNQLN